MRATSTMTRSGGSMLSVVVSLWPARSTSSLPRKKTSTPTSRIVATGRSVPPSRGRSKGSASVLTCLWASSPPLPGSTTSHRGAPAWSAPGSASSRSSTWTARSTPPRRSASTWEGRSGTAGSTTSPPARTSSTARSRSRPSRSSWRTGTSRSRSELELERGLGLIRGGEYFAAHEVLEDVWRAAAPEERDFFQGLVHVAVAWYQAGRGNRVGCERQLEKAARRLTPFAPEHRGLNLEILLRSVQRAGERVAGGLLELPAPVLAASQRPYGCAVVVWREGSNGREYLILHRVTDHGPEHEGDWAWTPPSGVRHPAEDVDDTAERELRE